MPGATNVSFSAIQTDFPAARGLAAAANPISMSEYYRGNSGSFYVPIGQLTSPTDGVAIPNSGFAIRVGMFRSLVRTVSYNLSIASSMNEGATITPVFDTVGVANQTMYWTIAHGTTAAADFSASSGSFTLSGNTGAFGITSIADATTEGAQTFSVQIRFDSTAGPVVSTSGTITLNDTSVNNNTPNGLAWAVQRTRLFPAVNPSATATYNSNGTVSASGNGSPDITIVPNWYTPTTVGAGSSHWIRFTQTATSGGGVDGGDALNTWHALTSSRFRTVSRTSNGYSSRTFSVAISTSASGTPIVSTGTLDLDANQDI